jgi:hypothetical protein
MLSKGITLVMISMMVFGVLNLIENMIHYNIGRSYKSSELKINFPSWDDFVKIIIVMIVFGLTQGLMTEFFIKD